MLLGVGGLPPVVNQDIPTNIAQNPAPQDSASIVPVTPAQVTPGDQQLVQAVERFVQPGEIFNYLFQVKMSTSLKKPVVQVLDKATGEEVCQIPPDTVIQMLTQLKGTGNGTVVDRKV